MVTVGQLTRGAHSITPSFALALLSAVLACTGCATMDPREVREDRQRLLIGKTKQDLVACAGVPIWELEHDNTVEMIYYKEASLLEESFPGSKGSVPKVHHGCRAGLLLKENRVIGVQYQSVPESYSDEDHCDEIFQSCAMISP